ncbi:hypothetical protein [Idiomarina sp. UBA1919]|uniref:hypothetical protein n=1 Tax=Idiomarina sp. UBA1919 TaxID=1946640 RepID=UPI00257947AB|nr:hypothetical protein [Idiomarina sp. UBA1919]|tara:strand:- start:1546 stop:2133 length:588 start_codon:yes stop_codon:yes gene_type:complete
MIDKEKKTNIEPVPEAYELDNQGNIVSIKGRTLEVDDQSEGDLHFEHYFQAWVDGYQNDGTSHNKAVKNALYFAQNNIRSMLEVDKEEYLKLLSQQKAAAVEKLRPYSEQLSAIRNYKELQQLERSILLALYHYEYAAVEEVEKIHGISSGHDRDHLNAYLKAMSREPVSTDNIWFDDAGNLNFNVADRLGLITF